MNKILLSMFFISILIMDTKAQTANTLSINDTREVNDLPNFAANSIRADFKRRTIIGVPGEGVFSTNLILGQWSDNSGDKNHQLNFNNGGIFYRNAFATDTQWSSWKQLLLVNENGNVGIGTTDPQFGLLQLNAQNDAISALRLQIGSFSMNGQAKFAIDAPGIVGGRFIVKEDGNVGIGTSNPDSKLAVNGTIHSKEVKVDMTGWPWPDYVFNKEYVLPTLEEVEKQINEKGHLENIPSEKEVVENGLNLGEMNAKLLQKIEELTLYNIQQSKEIQVLKKENKSVSERLAKIEQLLK